MGTLFNHAVVRSMRTDPSGCHTTSTASREQSQQIVAKVRYVQQVLGAGEGDI